MLDSGREYFFKYTVYRMILFSRLAKKALDMHIEQNIQRNIHNYYFNSPFTTSHGVKTMLASVLQKSLKCS